MTARCHQVLALWTVLALIGRDCSNLHKIFSCGASYAVLLRQSTSLRICSDETSIDSKSAAKFKQMFPHVDICGKTDDLYKMREVLDFIKETNEQSFQDEKELSRKLIKAINHKHLEVTGKGNDQLNDGKVYNKDIYGLKVTQSYINIKCNISKK